MRSCLFLLSAILYCLAACAPAKQPRLPDLASMQNPQGEQACARFFPPGNWQFVHSIAFTMENGVDSTVIGVTTLTGTEIECALVTVEGLMLFAAAYHDDRSFEIKRAVPPFDNPGFAEGLLHDVRTIFQPPAGSEVRIGRLADETPVCRYTAADGKVTDIMAVADDCVQIKSYTADLLPDRLIVGKSCTKDGSVLIPQSLELTTFDRTGYTLKMTLIRADRIQ
jgi:hypothetical protein